MAEAGYSETDTAADEPTKQELYEQAQELDIDGRSKMDKVELQEAVKEAETNNLQEKTRDELYDRALELDIDGRSKMNKAELAKAIQQEQD